jgi:hypothetical protein
MYSGVYVVHGFPKGSECHVCMCDRVMALSRFHEMACVRCVCVICTFPKSTERYVFTYDRSMTLNGLVVLFESY